MERNYLGCRKDNVVQMPPKRTMRVWVRVRYVRKAKPLVVEPITEEDDDSNEEA